MNNSAGNKRPNNSAFRSVPPKLRKPSAIRREDKFHATAQQCPKTPLPPCRLTNTVITGRQRRRKVRGEIPSPSPGPIVRGAFSSSSGGIDGSHTWTRAQREGIPANNRTRSKDRDVSSVYTPRPGGVCLLAVLGPRRNEKTTVAGFRGGRRKKGEPSGTH